MRELLLECSLRAALIGLGTAVVLGVLRVRSAAARHAAWTGVVALMLLLPVWMTWGPRATLRILPAKPLPVVAAPALVPLEDHVAVVPSASPAAIPPSPRAPWNWLAIVYAAGASLLLTRLAIGTIRARKLTAAMCAAPVTVGFVRPRVILPDNWRDWPQTQLDAVLTHEGEHVRRRDPLVQWLALFNRAIFWFHPLAWWLERHLSALAEEACDAAVLERGHDPHEYTSYLLQLARRVGQSGVRLKAVGMAMPGSSLPQRVRQILTSGPAPRLSRLRALGLAIGCTMLSAVFAAASIDREFFIPNLPQPPAPPAAPIAKSTPAPEPEKRHIVLYFDLDGSLPEMQASANASAIALVQQQTQQNAVVAILAWSKGRVQVVQDFTADHDRLIAHVQKLENNPSGESGKTDGILAAARLAGAVHDQKSLIYFSMPPLRALASPEEVHSLAEALHRNNTAIFPIDITGFAAGAQVSEAIKVGDVLTLTLKDPRNTPRARGVMSFQRNDAKAVQAREEIDSMLAPFTDRPFTVRPDGTIAVPELGDVQAAGLTIDQLESTLGPALAARLSTPKFPITGVLVEETAK